MRVKFNVDTQLFFQIGDPMDQSCATYVHNAMYSYANINAVCMPVVVKKGQLGPFIDAVKVLGAAGFDITMPHKTDVIDFLDECEEASRAFKCVNHVKVEDGKLIGIGLDGVGMGMEIESVIGKSFHNRHVLIIGGGAVAGPIASDLCGRGAKRVTIVNRTVGKAEYIANTLQKLHGAEVDFYDMGSSKLEEIAPDIGLAVQCTSLGGPFEGLFHDLSFMERFPDNCVCADVLYPDTQFLRKARECGLKTIDGRGMIFQQSIALMKFRFGLELGEDALREAEEAVQIAVAMRDVRNKYV